MKLIKFKFDNKLILLCYICALVVFLLMQTVAYVQNRLAYAKGELATKTLTIADFTLNQLQLQENGSLLCVGEDPQLVLNNSKLKFENVSINFNYSMPPILENVFWAKPGQNYSIKNTSYPQNNTKGLFLLPSKGVQSLRIDPGTVVGNRIIVHSIVTNQKRPFWAFYVPSAGQVACFAVVPGLLASGISILANTQPFKKLIKVLVKTGKRHG